MKPRHFFAAVLALLLVSAAGAAPSADDCQAAPREQWKPEAEARGATEALGYRVARIAARDGCYEVTTAHKGGKRFSLKFDPTDMRLVSRYTIKDAIERSDGRELAVR
ncbi:MAG: PepSY domain-containing protein [Gemmatimonadota bacterium]